MTPLEAAWEAVLACPEDAGSLRVLADALIERGDAQGELIHLQLRNDYPGWRGHLEAHEGELLGAPGRLARWGPRFERGLLVGASLISAPARDELEVLLTLPLARLLESLTLGGPLELEPVMAQLRAHPPLALRVLQLGSMGLSLDPLDVQALLAALPALEVLSLGAGAMEFGAVRTPRLRTLTLSLQGQVEGLGEAHLPALTSLALELPFRNLNLPVGLLSGRAAPNARSLTLTGALWPQQLQDLSRSALLRGLSRLDLTAEPETGWYGALLQALDAFAHLETFNLVADRHHPEWVAAVERALPQASVFFG